MSVSSSAEIGGEVCTEKCSQSHTKESQSPSAVITALSLESNGDNTAENSSSSAREAAASSATKATDFISSVERSSQDGRVKDSEGAFAQSSVGRQKVEEKNSSQSKSANDQDAKSEGKVCSFYKRSGRCRYGHNCRYLHPGPPAIHSRDDASISASASSKGSQIPSQSKPVCKFYERSGWCSYGYRCRFAHLRKKAGSEEESHAKSGSGLTSSAPVEGSTDLDDALVSSASQLSVDDGLNHQSEDPKLARKSKRESKPSKQKRCRFYDMGHCRLGGRCRFSHAEKQETQEDDDDATKAVEDESPKHEEGGEWQPARKPAGPITSRPLSELGEGDAAEMRETEISQLKKRFPGDKLDVSENDSNPSYRFTVKPSDPDWPYDLNEFELAVVFPLDYPLSPLQLTLPEDQVLPTIILRHISDGISEWLEARIATNKLSGKVELMMRPFLRWFDRSLMRLFTEGARKFKKEVYAKAAGFEFISYAKKEETESCDQSGSDAPAHPKEEFINHEMDENRGDEEEEEEDEGDDEDEEEEVEEQEMEEESGSIEEGGKVKSVESSAEIHMATASTLSQDHLSSSAPSKYVSPTENRRGTEIRFPRMEMSESAATLVCEKIKIRIQCSRCKDQLDLSVAPGLSMVVGCSKCQNQQAVGYRPCIIHQFSSVLGFLDLTGCVPVDLIIFECKFMVSCLECSANSNIQGIQYGQDRLVWCSKCHQKMSIALDTARFHRLVASAPEGKTEVVTVKKDRRQKDPAIREGYPLPANGTCKHYKKSFRWLRFPCCGKCYPCDECHDLAELDHEMKFASRMICGFCSKEQPYSAEKPCQSCGSNVTKSRTTHWEGGTGCRNKAKMSRNDKQKFSSLNKTTSRHAKKVEEFQKGKKKK